MKRELKRKALACLREQAAEMIGQLILVITLLGALAAWLYTGVLYAPLIVGAVGSVLFWVVYGLIARRKEKR